MAQKNRLNFSFRWDDVQRFTNERWERLIRTDALWSRSGSVVGELVRSVIIAGRVGGKGWGMMKMILSYLSMTGIISIFPIVCITWLNLVPRILSYPPPWSERERERPWKTLVTWLQDRIISEGGVLCLIFFCLVYWRSSRSDRNGKIDLTTTITETKGNFCLNKTIR